MEPLWDGRRKELELLLKEFGVSLKCPEKFYEEGSALAEEVFKILQQKSKYTFAGRYKGGSFGKKTDVLEADLDLVVVCNRVHLPLKEVLDDFEKVLTLYGKELKIKENSIKKTERSLYFCFDNLIEVDLLPAVYIHNQEDIWKKIEMDPKNSFYYNPSFVDKQIAFLKCQPGDTHTLIRLVKYWFKNLYFEKHVMGGSAMMELISVAAVGQKNWGKGPRPLTMLKAFHKALDIIANLDSLRLAFSLKGGSKWKRLSDAELHLQNTNISDIVPKVIGLQTTLEKKCFIIDPANPFQNFLDEGMNSADVIQKMKTFATETQNTLKEIERDVKLHGTKFLLALFKPHPAALTNLTTLLLPNYVTIDYDYPYSSPYCDMEVRKQEVVTDRKMKNAMKALKRRLLSAINAVAKGNPDKFTATDIENVVNECVKTSFELNDDLATVKRDGHEEMDITLSIPYKLCRQPYAVRFSMKWE
ncbi:unnamed protein product [Orchesella dallaii]|uniref:2'-5'-oligoadenylate synthetase 1 domain-containing protein n=1 Tax=Orchesella dallaii TaxID=48710 RepID=A0ABP1S671_9HEXA